VKLEYIHGGSKDRPLIRLYEFSTAEIASLRALLQSLARGSLTSVALHELEGVKAIRSCQVTLRLGRRDEGMRADKTDHFECVLTSMKWDNIMGLLEPFSQSNSTGFQWLDTGGPISLLISRDGRW
jgi:hypothetical protein